MAGNRKKRMFYVFCLFTRLYLRFRLSHALQTADLEEIYRLVSKILNFIACGLVLNRFCVSYGLSYGSKFAGPCAHGVWDPVFIPRPMSRAVLFVLSSLSWASLGPLDPKVCSLTAPWRLLGGSLVDCRYGSRLFVHSKNVGFYPSICIWAVRERTKAASIPTTSPTLSFHRPNYHRFC